MVHVDQVALPVADIGAEEADGCAIVELEIAAGYFYEAVLANRLIHE